MPCVQAIHAEAAKEAELQKHLQEIDGTTKLLHTLPQRVRHDVMVPFGSVAMFPGAQMVQQTLLLWCNSVQAHWEADHFEVGNIACNGHNCTPKVHATLCLCRKSGAYE
jgi:hypothetical protein